MGVFESLIIFTSETLSKTRKEIIMYTVFLVVSEYIKTNLVVLELFLNRVE